ncbi:MAG: MaoC family dehydratase N-terminal domain-containing protein [Desulfobacterales bacterium]|nr:MaoC family dehydratase N-terminal domain-containing protein [Desulfobacterales bacterium]
MGIYDDIKAMTGRESKPHFGADRVNPAMIRHWCEAMEDGNPLYTDEAFAGKSKYGAIVAPPQMVMTYTMPPLWPKAERELDPFARAIAMLQEEGYFGIIATTTSYEFFKPLELNNRISQKIKLSAVSPEKKTRIGTGHFLTAEQTYANEAGDVICVQMFTVLVFKPGA